MSLRRVAKKQLDKTTAGAALSWWNAMIHPTANPLPSALARGESQAYAVLYDRLGRAMLRVAGAILGQGGDGCEAEDAVQDVFVELVRGRERLGRVVDLDAYVFSMLRHAALRRLDRRQREQRHLRQMARVKAGKLDDGLGGLSEVGDELEAGLRALPAEQREVVTLKVDGGLTFSQIAAILNISLNTAASRYRYALEKLRQALE
jgi:RNA polymerase sigma-70 factor (ECF subfamily)